MKKILKPSDAVTLINNLMYELDSPVLLIDGKQQDKVTDLPEQTVFVLYARIGDQQLLSVEGRAWDTEVGLNIMVLKQMSEAKEKETLLKVRALV